MWISYLGARDLTNSILELIYQFIVYASFIIPGIYVFNISLKTLGLHWFVALIFGIGTGILLFKVVCMICRIGQGLKSTSKTLWLVLTIINMILIAGFPALFGIGIGMEITGSNVSLFEKMVAGSVCGLIFGTLSLGAVWSKVYSSGD